MLTKTRIALLISALVATQATTSLATGGGAIVSDPGAMQGKRFGPKGNPTPASP